MDYRILRPDLFTPKAMERKAEITNIITTSSKIFFAKNKGIPFKEFLPTFIDLLYILELEIERKMVGEIDFDWDEYFWKILKEFYNDKKFWAKHNN